MGRFSRSLILRVLAGLLVGIGMFYFKSAQAQTFPSCPTGQAAQYRYTGTQVNCGPSASYSCNTTTLYSSLASAGAACTPATGASFGSGTYGQLHFVSQTNNTYKMGQQCINTSGNVYSGNHPFFEAVCAPCPSGTTLQNGSCVSPPPSECTQHPADSVFWSAHPDYDPNGWPTTSCVNNCSATLVSDSLLLTANPDGTGGFSGYWRSSGQACQTNTPTLEVDVDLSEATGKCQVIQGKEVCTGGPIPLNCIEVNGSRSCYTNGDGGVCTTPQCQQLANAVKHPDNAVTARDGETGTPVPHRTPDGQPASPTNPSQPVAPDATYTVVMRTGGAGSTSTSTTARTFNHYSAATTSTSCTGPCGVGEAPPTGNGTGTGDGEGEGEGEGESGSFTGPGGTAKGFGESIDEFRSRAAAAPVVAGIATIANGIPTGGTCPKGSFSAWGTTFQIESHCTLLDQYGAVIRAVSLLGWALFAVVVFLRA